MKIVSLSTVYPTPQDPSRGLFVRSRLLAMASREELKIVAPLAGLVVRGVPQATRDGPADVSYPRWGYLPGLGTITAGLLSLQLLGPLLRLKREFPFEVIDAHFGYPEGVAAAMLSVAVRTPFVVTLRGSEQVHSRFPLRRRAMSRALRRAAIVIAVSERLRQLAIELGVQPCRAFTIPNGVDGDVFHPMPRAEARRRRGLPADTPVVLTAGHLIELKGHHLAVKALKTLRENGTEATLVIAGGPPAAARESYEPELHRLVASLRLEGSVLFAGQVPQTVLAEWMSAADVFCLASAREGWPNVVHEAMACGTPVVAADVGGIPEMIASSRYGLVARPRDEEALAAALNRALAARWDRPEISAWAQSRSWSHVAAEVIARLEEALSGSPARGPAWLRKREGLDMPSRE